MTSWRNSTESRLNLLETKLETLRADHNEALDTVWMLIAAQHIFYMHSGFSMLEAGCVRFKNLQGILVKNMLVICIGFQCWYIMGWALAYGVAEEPSRLVGSTQFFGHGFSDDKTLFRNWYFQGCFCATSATIVSGAIAERAQIQGFILLTILMTAIIYPFIAYWCWSGAGFLNYTDETGNAVSIVGPPIMDFAGSGIIHLTGGVGALLTAAFVGPRVGRFELDVDQNIFVGHNITFCVLGTIILWFGWYSFNPGSTLALHDTTAAYTASLTAVNTTLAPCVAGLVVFGLRAKVCPPYCLDVGGFCNGVLAGLVGITGACAFVQPWEAVFIGLIAGVIYQMTSMVITRLKIDDVVDAFAVHGANGAWGLLAAGFFGNPADGFGGNGILYGGNQLTTQIFAIVIISGWTGGLLCLILGPMKKVPALSNSILRYSDTVQEAGTDNTSFAANKNLLDHPQTVGASSDDVMKKKEASDGLKGMRIAGMVL
eukprot:TRINITY_DN12706_c0_g1_i1.p1 TRINITY_DN12706_c0_g1~~TRINITY_DN12706_c0_g1_i1.p1  ORF type:complete len:486 (+),score=94.40 TRINITY_DN12706_c0_g1_i1:136-1593(+)